jgi:hypothetical protein
MKIEIKRFILTSFVYPQTPIAFNLDDYNEVDRRMLWELFSPTLRGKSLKVEDMNMLLCVGRLTLEEQEIIISLKGLLENFVDDSNTIYRVTCEWENAR